MSRICRYLSCIIVCLFLACGAKEPYPLLNADKLSESQTATLLIPRNLVLVSINGQEVQSSGAGFMEDVARYRIPAGKNKVTLRYEEPWELWDEDVEVVRSASKSDSFVAKAQEVYQVRLPEITSLKAAKDFSDTFHFEVTEEQADLLLATEESDGKEEAAVTASSDSDMQKKASEQKSGVRLEQKLVDESAAQSPSAALRYWWKQADKTERRSFQIWLLDN